MAHRRYADREPLNLNMQGIIYQYKIGNKLYVGKTLALERKRQAKHKFEAYKLHKETPFARAIRKYGWDNVLAGYSVIERIEAGTKQELNAKLCERETYWIRTLDTLAPKGYNCYDRGQYGTPTYGDKKAMYEKISKSLKGKCMNPEATSKPVFCIEQGRWYPSVREAERANGLKKGTLNKAADGKSCTCGGLTWSHDGKPHEREDLIKKSRKPIVCIETGIEYKSIYEASKLFLPEEPCANTKPKIQMSLKHGWAVSGYHFKYSDK